MGGNICYLRLGSLFVPSHILVLWSWCMKFDATETAEQRLWCWVRIPATSDRGFQWFSTVSPCRCWTSTFQIPTNSKLKVTFPSGFVTVPMRPAAEQTESRYLADLSVVLYSGGTGFNHRSLFRLFFVFLSRCHRTYAAETV